MKSYTTVKNAALYEYEEKRSKFIGQIFPISSEIDAAEVLNSVKKKNYDARHNCSAYILKNGYERYNDDGEPQGTAGKPILEVIRKNGLSDVIIVVTRYFGGILLGAGGLTRAYSHCAAQTVSVSEIIEMVPLSVCEINCNYADYGNIKRLIDTMGGTEKDSCFGSDILMRFEILKNKTEEVSERLTEMTAGRLALNVTGERFGMK